MIPSSKLPPCPKCGRDSRFNVLLFADYGFVESRYLMQKTRFDNWMSSLNDKKLLVLELGAGLTVPDIRWYV
jgi:hypothetical protein